jgi:hypothetical protein
MHPQLYLAELTDAADYDAVLAAAGLSSELAAMMLRYCRVGRSLIRCCTGTQEGNVFLWLVIALLLCNSHAGKPKKTLLPDDVKFQKQIQRARCRVLDVLHLKLITLHLCTRMPVQ